MSLSESIAPKPQSSQKPAKVGHRKSRLGCQRCKQRRVKASTGPLFIALLLNVSSATSKNQYVAIALDMVQSVCTSRFAPNKTPQMQVTQRTARPPELGDEDQSSYLQLPIEAHRRSVTCSQIAMQILTTPKYQRRKRDGCWN